MCYADNIICKFGRTSEARCKATPSDTLVSGPSHSQIRMRAGGFGHYIIMTEQWFCYKNIFIAIIKHAKKGTL